jgi:hypothetical protein
MGGGVGSGMLIGRGAGLMSFEVPALSFILAYGL